MKRRGMPYVAKLKRDDPFRLAARSRRWSSASRRRASTSSSRLARGRGLPAVPLPYLGKGARMQHWIDRSGIAHQPMTAPFNGPQLA